MSSKMVWSRFQSIGKYGEVHKLRIQDLPSVRISDALDLFVKYFLRDEPIYKAVDIRSNPVAVKNVTDYFDQALHDPSCHKVICCSDDTDDVKDIMSVSIIRRCTDATDTSLERRLKKMLNSPEKFELNRLKLIKMMYELYTLFNPMKEYKLDAYYSDVGGVIAPAYRRLGIVEPNVKVRRMICESHKFPMTGGWMSAHSIQKAADLDGWETVHEIAYDYLANKYDVKFTNAPPTLKYMIARVTTSS